MSRIDGKSASAAFEAALADHSQAFGTFFLAKLLGLEIRFEDETCLVDMPVRDFAFNPQGSLHGGIIATVLDISMGHLIHHVTGHGAATLEMKISYLRPATKGRLTSVGRFVRRGRRVSYLESRMSDEEGRIVATASATWIMPQPAAEA